MADRYVSVSMTLSDPWPGFQDQYTQLHAEYLKTVCLMTYADEVSPHDSKDRAMQSVARVKLTQTDEDVNMRVNKRFIRHGR